MMRKIIFGIVFLCFQMVWGQEISILDIDTNEPVINVAVYNLDKSKTALSDFNGKCDLSVHNTVLSHRCVCFQNLY